MNYFNLARIFLLVPLIAIVVVTPSTLFPFIVGKYVIFRAAVDLAVIFFLLGLLQKNKESKHYETALAKVFKSPLGISISIFTIIFLSACFFGVNPSNSFWSSFERGEGGLQILHLWAFFILLSALYQKKDWKNGFYVAIFGGIFMFLYGLLAGLHKPGFIGPQFGDPSFRFQGSIGNPAYVAAVLIFIIFYALYLLVTEYKRKPFSIPSLAIIASVVLFSATFILAATRGAFLGLIAAIVACAGYAALRHAKLRPWLLGAIGILIALVSVLIYFRNTDFVRSLPGSRIFDISFSATTFQHRTIEWKVAIDGFKARPLLGWGPENFLFIFDELYNTKHFTPAGGFGAWFDRAHNIFLDYLSMTGILGLLSYLSIFIVFYYLIWRHVKHRRQNHDTMKDSLMVAIPVAYLVQGVVLFDVLTIYINLFFFLALTNYNYYLSQNEQ